MNITAACTGVLFFERLLTLWSAKPKRIMRGFRYKDAVFGAILKIQESLTV